MSEQPTVYSCPSCGALSKVDPEADDGWRCGECGHEFRRSVKVAPRRSAVGGVRRFVQRDVVSRRRQVEREKTVLPPEREVLSEVDSIEEETSGRHEDEVISDDGHKKVIRRRKKRRKQERMRPLLLSVVWIAMVIGAFVVLKNKMETIGGPELPEVSQEEQARRARIAEMQAYIEGHIRECEKVLREFWDAPADEAEKAQFVFAAPRVTPSMFRYSQQHGFLVPSGEYRLVGTNLVAKNDLRAIETAWVDEEDRRFEVVFLREQGTWRIDWEAYVRYCSVRWDVFVSGAVRAEGDFRLFMREKKLSSIDGGVHIGLKFYPPDYDARSRRKGESPTVLVRADSELGGQVRAVLDGLEDEVELGEPVLWTTDPKDMARVRVVLEWQETLEGEQFLYLKEVKASSWHAEEIVEALKAPDEAGPVEDAGEEEAVDEPAGEASEGEG